LSATPPSDGLTAEQEAEFREALGRAVAHGRYRWVHADGKARRRPLPWRVRARLRLRQAANGLGTWLCEHGHHEAALRLWRARGGG